MWLTNTKRTKHFLAMVLIGDGVMALVHPKRDAEAWRKGPKCWRKAMRALEKRPGLTRAIGVAQIAAGVVWALSQESDD